MALIAIVSIIVVSIVVAAWVYRRYEEPPPLTPLAALRYLLMCAAVFLLSLGEVRNLLMEAWWPVLLLCVSMALLAALVIVLVGELCPS